MFKVNNIRREFGVFNTPTSSSNKENKMLFNHMMNEAKIIITKHDKSDSRSNENNLALRHPIYDFIKLIGLRIQTHYLTNLLYNIEGIRLPDIDYWHMFFSNKKPIENGKTMYDFFERLSPDFTRVNLKEDLVLPWPWENDRYSNSVVNIGVGRFWGEWSEDPKNHAVEMWLPMRIGFVNGGNHSITSGILQGVGELTPRYVFDISPIYEMLYTDGLNYYRNSDNSAIDKVLKVEFAVLFEIGRLMIENNIK